MFTHIPYFSSRKAYFPELQQPTEKKKKPISLITYNKACDWMYTLTFPSCQITYMPKYAFFCTVCVCISAILSLKTLKFCDTVNNQTGGGNGKSLTVLEMKPVHYLGFFPSEEYFFLLPTLLSIAEFSYAFPIMSLYPNCTTAMSDTWLRLATSGCSSCSLWGIQPLSDLLDHIPFFAPSFSLNISFLGDKCSCNVSSGRPTHSPRFTNITNPILITLDFVS